MSEDQEKEAQPKRVDRSRLNFSKWREINWKTVGAVAQSASNPVIALLTLVLAVLVVVQFAYQKMSTDRVWSAQQIATIFDEDCSLQPCRPKASVQSRAVAVRYYVAIEGHRGKAKLRGANLFKGDLAGLDLTNVDFSEANFQRADLSDAILKQTKFGRTDLRYSFLMRAQLIGADLKKAHFEGANLSKAKLMDAHLEESVLGRCDVSAIDLASGEDVQWTATLQEVDLEGAKMTGASICRVDLTSVKGLTQKQLEDARGDENTRLPPGLTRPKSWPTKAGVRVVGEETTEKNTVGHNPIAKKKPQWPR